MTNDQDRALRCVVVSGVSGFVGGVLINALGQHDHYVPVPIARSNSDSKVANFILVTDLSSATNWSHVLQDVVVAIHPAARVHVVKAVAIDALAEFRKVFVEGTINLARQAAAAKVRRFIFINSIKVDRENSFLGHPFDIKITKTLLGWHSAVTVEDALCRTEQEFSAHH